MYEPADVAIEIERNAVLPAGSTERFSGYGVMSMPFVSGHILAMRRFPATSIGPGYTSVWHRDPDGRWVFYQDQAPAQSCSRYFGSALSAVTQCDIRLEWIGPRSFTVTIAGDPGLCWDLTLASTLPTRLLTRVGGLMPDAWWTSPRVLQVMGRIASTTLQAGKVQLAGRVPNGQQFIVNPKQLWMVAASRAEVAGRDLGPVGSTGNQAQLGDFWIPTRGIFAIGHVFFEPRE